MEIKGVDNFLQSLNTVSPEQEETGGNFQNYINKSINELNSLQNKYTDLADKVAAGKDVELHDVMVAAQEADVAMRLTMQVRNKILDAYREVMRMSV